SALGMRHLFGKGPEGPVALAGRNSCWHETSHGARCPVQPQTPSCSAKTRRKTGTRGLIPRKHRPCRNSDENPGKKSSKETRSGDSPRCSSTVASYQKERSSRQTLRSLAQARQAFPLRVKSLERAFP